MQSGSEKGNERKRRDRKKEGRLAVPKRQQYAAFASPENFRVRPKMRLAHVANVATVLYQFQLNSVCAACVVDHENLWLPVTLVCHGLACHLGWGGCQAVATDDNGVP